MASRIMTIRKADMSRRFFQRTDDEPVMCAFNLDVKCTPDCAACAIVGTSPKAECSRGEVPFEIGYLRA